MTLADDAHNLCREMGLPDNFLSSLLDEDDWSFIIKAVAFVEAILSNAITASVNDVRIADAVSRLFLRDKLRFAKSLGLIHKDGAKFIDKLADMRNAAAHDIHAINFRISEFLNGMQNAEREVTIKALAYFAAADDLRDHLPIIKEKVINDPKGSVWYSLVHFVAVMWWKKENAKMSHIVNIYEERADKFASA